MKIVGEVVKFSSTDTLFAERSENVFSVRTQSKRVYRANLSFDYAARTAAPLRTKTP